MSWDITTDRFVAFIDFMGFKDMLNKYSHTHIYKFMKDNRHLEYLLISESQQDHFYLGSKEIKQIQVSDSLILVTEDSSCCSFLKLIEYINVLVANHVNMGIMVRGYVSHGLLTYDETNHIFFGEPFVQAFKNESELKYIGVIIDKTIRPLLNIFYQELLLIPQVTYPPYADIHYGVMDTDCFTKTIDKKQLNANWYNHLKQFMSIPYRKFQEQEGIDLLLKRINDLRQNIQDHKDYAKLNEYIDNTLSMAEKAISGKFCFTADNI